MLSSLDGLVVADSVATLPYSSLLFPRALPLHLALEWRRRLDGKCECVVKVPHTSEFLMPLLTVVPLQLLAYFIADMRRCNVDQPRNLAKSVTVE